MAARAFVVSFSQPFWLEVIGALARQGVVDPVYWTGHRDIAAAVRDAFPLAVFHERYDAVRGIPAPACAALPLAPLSQALLRELAYHQTQALTMMERMDIGDAFPYQERVRLYHRHLRYWRSVLQRYRPDVVLFHSSPHFVYDYVLYALCQMRAIRTVVLRGTSLPGWSFAAESLEAGSRALAACYQRKLAEGPAPVRLAPDTEAYLQGLRGSYADARPEYMTAQLQRDEAWTLGGLARRLGAFARYPAYLAHLRDLSVRAARAALRRKPAETLVKRRGRPVEQTPSVLAYTLLKLRAQLKQRRLKAFYQALTTPVALDRPYVFCALHMQPERTTSPDGGVFVHQELMIELLAAALPHGWRLYVKEHGSQFVTEFAFDSASAQSRSTAFYRHLAALPGVDLVPLGTSSFDLIDRAQAVATVTGTVGWEAVVRGKPALTFGYPWYMGCEGVFYTPGPADLEAALGAIAGGYRIDHERVRRFAAAIETVGFQGFIYEAQRRAQTLAHADLVRICTDALRTSLRDAQVEAGP